MRQPISQHTSTGKKVLEIEIINFIYYINGTDYLADVRKALGKA